MYWFNDNVIFIKDKSTKLRKGPAKGPILIITMLY